MILFTTVLLRLGVALILGVLIGLERESRERNIGMRTNAIVSLGSALFMIVSAFGFKDILGTPHVQLDPSRIAAQVVSGIGFIGAGAILFRKEIVRGLTTAATVWLVAAVGLACGAGLLLEATTATVLTLIVLVALRYVERVLWPQHATHLHFIRVEVASDAGGGLIGQVYDICKQVGADIERLQIHTGDEAETIEVGCRITDTKQLTEVVGALKTLREVHSVQVDRGDVPTNSLVR